jgi:hypothetical protein
LPEFAVVARREIHVAHAAFADHPLDAIGADSARPRSGSAIVRYELSAECRGRRVEQRVRGVRYPG